MAQMTAADFRALRPAFADASKFTDASVNLYLNMAWKLLPERRWGELLPLGYQLYAAHYLAMDEQTARMAASGGVGAITGPVSRKELGPAVVTYDTAAAQLRNAGVFNLTPYGIQFWQLARMVGIGPIQL